MLSDLPTRGAEAGCIGFGLRRLRRRAQDGVSGGIGGMHFGMVVVLAGQLAWPVAEYDAMDEPIWCANTNSLVAQISNLGGQRVKRRYDGGGVMTEWFVNDHEELIIEHNPGGDSCLVRLRTPDW